MDAKIIQLMQTKFDDIAKRVNEENIEFWFARDLMEPLGYARWENFVTAINRAVVSSEQTGFDPDDHFRGITKMVTLGSGANREIDDFMLTQHA